MDMTHIALAVLPLALFAATFAVWLREMGVRPIAALLRGAIPDSMELSHGTGPTDERSYCFGMSFLVTGVPSTTNYLTAVALFGTNTVSGPVAVTNGEWSADLGHLVAENGEKVALYFWDDANSNGVRDAWECCATQRLAVAGHDNALTNRLSFGAFDTDNDEILDWWEISRGLSPTNAADAYLDPDGDGLINLHEYWADCNPLVPDGSNTLLSVMARSIDCRIEGKGTNSCAMFVDYEQRGTNLLDNSEFWGSDLDLSSMSVWHNDTLGRSRGVCSDKPMACVNVCSLADSRREDDSFQGKRQTIVFENNRGLHAGYGFGRNGHRHFHRVTVGLIADTGVNCESFPKWN